MDRWGRCDECARWFYMAKADACCPVCQSAPSAVVDRDEDSAASAGMA